MLKPREEPVVLPSEVSTNVGFFDRFAGRGADFASRAPFFAFCLFLVGAWLLEGVVKVLASGRPAAFLDDTYQLQINTTTTIITFLLVALLQNSQTRDNNATQHKLNAIADGLADMMDRLAERYDDDELAGDVEELRAGVGIESKEGTTRNRGRTWTWRGTAGGGPSHDT